MLLLFRNIRRNDEVCKDDCIKFGIRRIYGFDDFKINFTYPKKVVNSIIDDEYLDGRERFRYKKAVILMGANATGKTSIGKALLKIITYINTGNIAVLYDMIMGKTGSFLIDFVNDGFCLHRLIGNIDVVTSSIDIKYQSAKIDKMDSYEKCITKLEDHTNEAMKNINSLKKIIGPISYRFAYPEIESSILLNDIDRQVFLKTLRAVIGTLDPTLKEVTISRDLKDTFIIKRKNTEIIIQEGKLLNREVLSSGTAEKIDVAPYFEESSVVILCKVMGKSDFDQKSVDENVYEWYQKEGVHRQYYGEIVKVLVKDYK